MRLPKLGLLLPFAVLHLRWWTANYRTHHRHSEQDEDIHSPIQRGFWWSRVAWIFTEHLRILSFAGLARDLRPFRKVAP
jgi:hypothetical protein